MTTKPLSLVLLVCAGLAGLTGCGGGSDDAATPPVADTAVPASATVSSEAFTGYAAAGAAVSDDTAEPLSLAGVEPPVSETTEPADVG